MSSSPTPLITDDELPAISRNTVTNDVLQHVRKWILSGRLRGGDRLVEQHLAQDLGVSRAPVREALRQLAQEGLIETVTHRGTYVREFDLDDIQELFWLRIALEMLATRLAIKSATPAELGELERLVSAMEAIDPQAPDLARATELDTAFHAQLCRMSHHKLLFKIWSSMADQIRLAIHSANTSFAAFSGFAGGHRQVLEAIQAGNQDAAAAEIEKHILFGLHSLLASVEDKAHSEAAG